MRIIAISDTHGLHEELVLPDGDMIIFAGDMCGWGHGISDIISFGDWIYDQPHKYKIVIAGNHDWTFQDDYYMSKSLLEDITYLQDDMVEIEGIKIYGSPWQPTFFNWAFNLDRGDEISRKWDLIPDETDILVTHGPPMGHLDWNNTKTDRVGCYDLNRAVKRVKPRYHIFGHIHNYHGIEETDGTTFINASNCNDRYVIKYDPIVIDYKLGKLPERTKGIGC